MITPFNDEYFMRQAYMEAEKAFSLGEIPVGAVIVVNNQIIARTHNFTELLNDVTAHAEIQAITAAADKALARNARVPSNRPHGREKENGWY